MHTKQSEKSHGGMYIFNERYTEQELDYGKFDLFGEMGRQDRVATFQYLSVFFLYCIGEE